VVGHGSVNRAAAIERILSRRARDAEEIHDLDQTVLRLDGTLTHLADAQQALQSKVDPDALAMLATIGGGIAELRRRVALTRNDLGRTAARLARPTLAIGVVGRGGQGKSRFLQSLTGLTDREIPAARGGFMTGAPSLIKPGTGPTTAEVEFHDERSFLTEIIAPYFRHLGLGREPGSLAEFERMTLPAPSTDGTMREIHAYDHLHSYQEHLPSYMNNLLDSRRVQSISPEQILQYVAQHDGAGTQTHDFRAVRRVRITAQFPQQDLGRLAVIDLPGLGDTNLHDEQVLRHALDNEVDLVLFVRRPDPLREGVHDVDVDLYDVARTALPELPVDRWSFLVLNRVEGGDGDNTAMVQEFAAAVERSRIQVTGIAAANCTNPDQVADVFDLVVSQAVRTLDELDRSLIDQRRIEVSTLLGDASRLVAEAQAVVRRAVPSGAWFAQFLLLFKQTYGQLAHSIDQLVKDLREATTEHDDDLAEAIQRAMAEARASVKTYTAEEITFRQSGVGGYANVLNDLMNEHRAQIARQFLQLDAALKLRVDAMHEAITDVLNTAGGLKALDLGSGVQFLRAFTEVLPQDGSAEELRLAFTFITEFTLNYRGLIQHRVRRALAKLEADTMPFDPASGAEGIEYIVQELVAETLFDVETELRNVVFEPREAVFAAAEEFRDRVLRAHGVTDEWRTVYEALRSDLWADEFAALAENTQLFNQWTRAVDGLAAVATRG
jgi:hypothetical protein